MDRRDPGMSAAVQPQRHVERHNHEAVLALSGDWLIGEAGLHGAEEGGIRSKRIGDRTRLRFVTDGLAHWDSALVSFVWSVQSFVETHGLTVDLSGPPEALRRMIALANATHDEHLTDEPIVKLRLRERISIWVFATCAD